MISRSSTSSWELRLYVESSHRYSISVGLSLVVPLIVSVSLLAQKKDDKKQSDEQKKEVQALVKMVDDAAAGAGGAQRSRPGVGATKTT